MGLPQSRGLGQVLGEVPSLPLSSDVSLASYHFSSLLQFLQMLSRVHQSPPRLVMGINKLTYAWNSDNSEQAQQR